MGRAGDQRKVEEITRIVLRPLASPLAQTVSGVGCFTFAASLYGGLALGLEDVQHRTCYRRSAAAERRARLSRGHRRAGRPGREGGRGPQTALDAGGARGHNAVG